MRYNYVASKRFITFHFTKIMCNDTDLASKKIIDNIERHDYDYEDDEFGVEISNILHHKFGAYEVVCISNNLVEYRMKEGTREEKISLPFEDVKQRLVDYYTNDD